MCFLNTQGLAQYGTVLEITTHVVQPDGRLMILTKGKERFRLDNIAQEKPVVLCEVEMLHDSGEEEPLQESADKAKELFRNLLQVNARYRKIAISDEHLVCSHTMRRVEYIVELCCCFTGVVLPRVHRHRAAESTRATGIVEQGTSLLDCCLVREYQGESAEGAGDGLAPGQA